MTAPILLTGGTGTLGSRLAPMLVAAGRPVRVLTRGDRKSEDGIEYVTGDLDSGEGVAAAVAGVATIVHCAGAAKGDEIKARTLLDAARGGGASHLVHVSVVGCDRVP